MVTYNINVTKGLAIYGYKKSETIGYKKYAYLKFGMFIIIRYNRTNVHPESLLEYIKRLDHVFMQTM